MAKTIMVSNKVYADLKKAKGNDKSFSEVITEAIEKSVDREKTFGNLMKFAGILKDEKEDLELWNWYKRSMKKWEKRLYKDLP